MPIQAPSTKTSDEGGMDSRLFLSRTFHRILEHPLGLVRLIIVLTSILAFGVVAYDLVTDRQRTEQAALPSFWQWPVMKTALWAWSR